MGQGMQRAGGLGGLSLFSFRGPCLRLEGAARDRAWELTLAANAAASDAERGESFAEMKAWFDEDVEKEWSHCQYVIAIGMRRRPDDKKKKQLPEWEELAAVACAVQNLHLMATALGAAGYWSSWNPIGRDSPGMLTFLGLDPAAGDRCLGLFMLASSDRVDKYRSARGALGTRVMGPYSEPIERVRW